jgi:hypothetical protein
VTIAYASPKLAIERASAHGRGLTARVPVDTGELVVVWGGDVICADDLLDADHECRAHSIQIESDLFLVSMPPWPNADFVNHSCDPTAVLQGSISLVARRYITTGEEITFDYATCDSVPYDEFDCRCGSRRCRGRVTADDWRRPELWMKYGDGFSPYLLRRIRALQVRGLAS